VNIDHLNRFELHDHLGRSQTVGEMAQLRFEGDLQAVSEEGDKDVRFDARLGAVVDRPNGEIMFEFLECLLDFGQLDVKLICGSEFNRR